MLIEDPHEIDLSVSPNAEGKLDLVIVDAALTPDPVQREKLLHKKIEIYTSYVSDEGFSEEEGFREDFPNVRREDVTFVIYCQGMPPESVRALHFVKLLPPYEAIVVPVIIKSFDEAVLNSQQKQILLERRNKRWWQFWI